MRAPAAMAGLAAVTLSVIVGPAWPAAGAPLGQCTTTRGAVVAVDFGHWDGPVVRGCGVGASSGLTLLDAAGFSRTGDHQDGPDFVCRLGNAAFHSGTEYPTPATDPCVRTPPASAYWTFWTAKSGQRTWTYSRSGGAADSPKPGEVELWTFGGSDANGTSGSAVPTITPDALRAHNPAPTGGTSRTSHPTASRTTTSAGRSHPARAAPTHDTAPSSPAATARHSGPAPGTTSAAPASAAPATTAPATTVHTRHGAPAAARAASGGPDSGGTPNSPGPTQRIVAARPASRSTAGSTGSPAPLIAGIAVALLLAGGAGWTTWRRRRAG